MTKSNITVNENKKNLKESNRVYNKFISLGIKDVQKNNFESAVKNFLKALRIDSKKYQALINLSNVYILQNKIKKGIDILKDHLIKHTEINQLSNNKTIITNIRHYEELKLALSEVQEG